MSVGLTFYSWPQCIKRIRVFSILSALLLLNLVVSSVFASSLNATHINNNAQEVQAAHKSLPNSPCSFSGNFVQVKKISGLNKPLESFGDFYYHCEDGVVWSTQMPTQETLIFNRSGKNIQIKNDQTLTLKGRQSKLLGKLLNSMMGGNQTEIEQQFIINNTEQGFELLPKKKALKRALKRIQLRFSQTDNKQQINIEILDRKNQKTSITALQTHIFNLESDRSTKARQENCSHNSSELACGQMYSKAN